ncbi:DMT family transporter [Mycetocola tolaasinivorans]|uniref:DMT family transporter n=1 Tax=Mycetocola tolaasinivorans TaxID=76635 RepID=A0A3L7ACR2_9MICO|nr:DMT family transporter [Mycetocola tolaasinivorans]RLP77441.1 DMT family transporter [Mycetocola tolaasinivorans]
MSQRSARLLPRWFALILAVIIGSAMSVQVRVNGHLGEALGDGLAAAAVSFGTGLVVLSVGMLISRHGRRGVAAVFRGVWNRTLPWWILLAGFCGAFLVFSQSRVGIIVGIAMFSVAVVAGQTVSGLIIDGVGFGPLGRVRPSANRMIGAALVLVATGWSVSGKISTDIPLWALALPFIAGILLGWQQAVNGRVRAAAQSVLSATFLNFLFGTFALLVAVFVSGGPHFTEFTWPTDPTLYLGGIIGCVCIGLSAWIVSSTGVLLMGMGMIAGQLVTAVILDLIDFGADQMSIATVGGALLALVAAILAGLPRWGRHRPAHAVPEPADETTAG